MYRLSRRARRDRTLRALSADFLETIEWLPILLSDGLNMCMRRVVNKEWKAKTMKKNQDTHVLCDASHKLGTAA